MDLPPLLAGYRLVRKLGAGGTADVYLYEQAVPQRLVAIKVDKHPLDGESARTRFRNEANSMAELAAHPNILTIYDAGVTTDGRGYLVLEYAPDGNYWQLRKNQTLPLEQVLDIGIAMCSALYTAHHRGIIHRDVKPANILISQQNVPLLSDFGISATIYDSTTSGGYSPAWAAPEVLQKRGFGTERSDIYSLAATLIGLLSGRSPFELAFSPRTQHDLETAILTKELPSFAQLGLPKIIEKPLRKALSKDPEARYYSALELARDLQAVQLEAFGRQSRVEAAGTNPYPTTASTSTRRGTRTAEPPTAIPNRSQQTAAARAHRKRILITLCAILGAALLLAGVWFFGIAPQKDSLRLNSGTTTVETDPGLGAAGDDEGTDPAQVNVPTPTKATATITGSTAHFTWTNPQPLDGDTYFWRQVETQGSAPTDAAGARITEPDLTLDGVTADQICLQISIVRANHQTSQTPLTLCATRKE